MKVRGPEPGFTLLGVLGSFSTAPLLEVPAPRLGVGGMEVSAVPAASTLCPEWSLAAVVEMGGRSWHCAAQRCAKPVLVCVVPRGVCAEPSAL